MRWRIGLVALVFVLAACSSPTDREHAAYEAYSQQLGPFCADLAAYQYTFEHGGIINDLSRLQLLSEWHTFDGVPEPMPLTDQVSTAKARLADTVLHGDMVSASGAMAISQACADLLSAIIDHMISLETPPSS